MAGGTDNNQLKSAVKTRWRWPQQFVDDDKDGDKDDNNKHDEHDNNDKENNEQDYKDNTKDKHNDDDHDDDSVDVNDDDDNDNKADTATAVGIDDNGGNSDGRGHRQQSTKIGSKDTVAVATAIH
jgi:hypothetical protein